MQEVTPSLPLFAKYKADPFILPATLTTFPLVGHRQVWCPVVSNPREKWLLEHHHTFWQHTNGLVHFEFFRLGKLCKFPTGLIVVRTGFTRSYRLHEEIRFACSKKRKWWNNFLQFKRLDLFYLFFYAWYCVCGTKSNLTRYMLLMRSLSLLSRTFRTEIERCCSFQS